MSLSIRQMDRICLILVVIISVFCGYLVVSSNAKKEKRILQENERLSKRLKDLKLTETSLLRLNQALGATREELKSLNEKIPESAAIGVFLKDLDALMKERETTLISVQPLPAVREKLFTRIPIRLIFKGTFLRVYQVLHDLETMNRTVVLEKMIINRPKIMQICRVDLTASIFER